MAELNDINFWELIKDVAGKLWIIFCSLVTFLLMLIIGLINKPFKKYIEEHAEMHLDYKDRTGNSAHKLQEKKDQDWNDVIEMLKSLKKQNEDIQHDVNGARQDTANLTTLLKAKGII